MSSLATAFGGTLSNHPLRTAFLKWQCRVRQMSMRDNAGRPDDAIMPAVIPDGEAEPMGHVITILNKTPRHSMTPEFEHMAAKTNDPAQRRDNAIRFLSSSYYQKAAEFSDILTSTFPSGSEGAARLLAAGSVTLVFEAYAQRFDIRCQVRRLAADNHLHRATLAHNRLFNPAIPGDTIILGFEPDWEASASKDPN